MQFGDVEAIEVADNSRYRVTDFVLDDLTMSLTELLPEQSTKGHSHDGHAEAYMFVSGRGRILIGERTKEVDGVRFVFEMVPAGVFHRVFNESVSDPLVFLSVFAGKRKELKSDYRVKKDE